MITFDTIEKEEKVEPESTVILFSEIMGVQNEFQNSPDIFSPTQGIMDEKEEMLKDMDTDFAEKNQKQEDKK